ncbi:unnamed protein product, partial [Tetraodon nigroviridis]
KTPPDRAGIIFEIGAQLEARDRHKKWSGATAFTCTRHLQEPCLTHGSVVLPSGMQLPSRKLTTTESGSLSTSTSGATVTMSGFSGTRPSCGRWSVSA